MAKALEAFHKGKYAHALVLFEKEIQGNPNDPVLYYHFALSCFYTNNFKKAIDVTNIILEKFPRFIEIDRTYKLLIFSLIQLQKWDSALETINQRLEISPNDEILLSFRAHVYEKNGKIDKAIEAHRQILNSHPDYKNSLNNLGYLLLVGSEKPTESDMNEAVACLKRAMQLDPKNPAYLDSFGTLLEKTGKKEQAIKALEKAVAFAPGQSELLDHLGKLRNEQS